VTVKQTVMPTGPRDKNPEPADPDVTRERQLQELGSPEPACVICGLAEPEVLQLHHLDGEANSDLQGLVCLNCHHLIQATMRAHEDLLAHVEDKSPFEQIASSKFGRAAFEEQKATRERAEGEWFLTADQVFTRKIGPKWWKDLGLPPFPGRALPKKG